MKNSHNILKVSVLFIHICLLSLLQACGGGGGSNDNSSNGGGNTTPDMYTISGSVTGLVSGSSLTLQLNSSETVTINNDGSFSFSSNINNGGSYTVSVISQPSTPAQTCTLANSNGIVSGANVTNVTVNCVANSVPTYAIGGTVTGLIGGNNLVLQLNNGETLAVSADGSFTFTSTLPTAASYSVAIFSQPTNTIQVCTVSNANGTVSTSNVSSVNVSCITPAPSTYTVGGNVTGLQTGSSLELVLNGSETITVSASGTFLFSSTFTTGSGYAVSVSNQPSNPAQTCNVMNGSGTISGSNISNISVSCAINTYTIGGNVNGLSGSGLVLRLNGSETLAVSGSTYTFSTQIASGQTYNVSVSSQPSSPTQICSIANGSGTVTSLNITNANVTCVIPLPAAPTLNRSVSNKQIHFAWNSINDATYYRLLQNIGSGYTPVQSSLTSTTYDMTIRADLFDWDNTTFMLEACNAQGCTSSTNSIDVVGEQSNALIYVKASNPDTGDYFGDTVDVSYNGDYMVVSAWGEDSNGSSQADNSLTNSGAVYIFHNDGTGWAQQAYLKANNPGSNDFFGRAVAISDNGDRVVVCAQREDSNSSGVNGAQNDSLQDSGAAYVFARSGSTWVQEAFLKANNPRVGAEFCRDADINGQGNTIVIGGNTHNLAGSGTGNAYVFNRSGSVWNGPTMLTASNAGELDSFGLKVKINSVGNTIVVSSPFEDGGNTGVNPLDSNNVANSGAVYVFYGSGLSWSQQAYIKASNPDPNDSFGWSIDIDSQGHNLVVYSWLEQGGASGINGNQLDNSKTFGSGAIYAFNRNSTSLVWSQVAYMKRQDNDVYNGYSIGAITQSGNTLLNNADRGSTRGIEILTKVGANWTFSDYKTLATNGFIRLSGNESVLAVADSSEDSSSSGINGDRTDTSMLSAGAVYLY